MSNLSEFEYEGIGTLCFEYDTVIPDVQFRIGLTDVGSIYGTLTHAMTNIEVLNLFKRDEEFKILGQCFGNKNTESERERKYVIEIKRCKITTYRENLSYEYLAYDIKFRANEIFVEFAKQHSTDNLLIYKCGIVGYLKIKSTNQIIKLLQDRKQSTFTEIVQYINKSPSTTSWNIKRLVDVKIMIKTKTDDVSVYRLIKPDLIKKLLVKSQNTLLDRTVDNFGGLIENL